jgi:YD repeat-containing protein
MIPARSSLPQGDVTQFGYDANNNLLTVTDAKSQQTVYTYSTINRTSTSAVLTVPPF